MPSFNIFIYSLYANILFLFFCETSSNIPKVTKFSKLECIVAVLKLLWFCIAPAFNIGFFTKHLYTVNAVLDALPMLFTFASSSFIRFIKFLAVLTA